MQCTSHQHDGFYRKAGAIFEQNQLWTASGNELILLHSSGLSSGSWAWFDFEEDFKAWMDGAYPDVASQIFAGRIIRDGRSAVIAMDFIDEFIEQSSKYPRSADADQEMVEMITVALFTE